MKEVELFEHNEVAYEQLNESLKHNKCTTLNRATGTGKSFIALKFLYENRDKKYLYIAPTYQILEQLKRDCYKIGITPEDLNIDTMIYRSLLDMDMDELYQKYDGFIFDEYHRAGAKKTYRKIKQLKRNLENSDDTKKFIGLTATPIRYLDHERNMTEEIFDGNVASSLTLAEAMLEELLPVPLYINSKLACKDELDRISRRVSRLAPTKEKQELEKRIEKIEKEINNGPKNKKEMISKYIQEKDGKYIIFCNTIQSLEETYKEVDSWFSGLGKVKKYKVYSNQQDTENKEKGLKQRTSREVNQANLDAFNNEKDGISVLLCVDVLNEGVHVDDIDGVIMMRKTTSPIIYFQQIGRALSFSGRKKQIKIFDLVNNFGNHNAIDEVFTEFKEEMKRLIKLHPEKAEKYQAILDKFKIMDETKEILSELNDIDKNVTPDKIIASKIDYSINLLKEKLEKVDEVFHLFSDEDSQKAYATVSRYYKNVDNEQFKRLLDLDIILPEELSMSYEERLSNLKGYNSIKEYEEAEYDLCIEEILEFMANNKRKPDIHSDDDEERKLGLRYLNAIVDLNEEQKAKLIKGIRSNKIGYEPWEKVLLGKKVRGKDIRQIIKISEEYLKNGQALPEHLKGAITNITFKYNIRQNEQLYAILDESEKIEEEQKQQINERRLERLSKIIETLETSENVDKETADEIARLSFSDRNYIKRKYSVFKKQQYNKIIPGAEKSDLMAFCRKMKSLKSSDFASYYSNIEQDKKMYETLKGIIEFMTKNGGRLPNKKSDNELERKLAEQLEGYINSENVLDKIHDLEKDMQSEWYSPEQIMYELIFEKFQDSDIKLAILKNVEFFNKKRT